MRKITIVLTMAAMAMFTAGSIAADTDASVEDPPGRIVAARGTLDTISGTLRWERDEWYLSTGNDRTYELHLGPYGHRDEPLFTAGAPATTEGFVYGTHVAPITVETAGTTHRFWTSERMPMWAGAGEGGGRVAWNDGSVPQGQRLADQGESADGIERGFRNNPPGAGRFRN